jgi:hypothetical protein
MDRDVERWEGLEKVRAKIERKMEKRVVGR